MLLSHNFQLLLTVSILIINPPFPKSITNIILPIYKNRLFFHYFYHLFVSILNLNVCLSLL